MTKTKRDERDRAIAQLREWLKPGDTVYTILDHVSASGMSRAIRVLLMSCVDGKPEMTHPNYAVGRALDLRHWKRRGYEQDALVMSGCGMDMGYALVYNLSRTLFPEFRCIGTTCPANDHANEQRQRNYTVGRLHTDGGYALRHQWL